MILVLAVITAIFFAGSTCGIFAMLVIGIHAEERRTARGGTEPSRAGTASRRLLSTRTCDDTPNRITAGR